MKGNDVFVFVVCGADEHINTLNFSLKALRKFSKKNIIVVTDKSRNNIEIDCNNIIDVETPSSFDHHQASIYLKTGLHKFVDLSYNYCYLDSDVIALNSDCDKIFGYASGPVTFAADHCRIHNFSPYAVNCGCIENSNKNLKEFVAAIKQIIPDYEHDQFYNQTKGRELYRIKYVKENPLKNLGLIINYFLARYIFARYKFKHSYSLLSWGDGYRYSPQRRGWIDQNGDLIMYDLTTISKQLKNSSNFILNRAKRKWETKSGENIFLSDCNHLTERIKEKFKIDIADKKFQHWNGGVFLFNKNAVDFLEAWHQHTLEIFKDKAWKTRDQGTLAATVWQFGLQNQKLLPSEFNFIADYYSPNITYKKEKGFTVDNFKTTINPSLIHVYHHFGNKNWDVWQGIESILYNT